MKRNNVIFLFVTMLLFASCSGDSKKGSTGESNGNKDANQNTSEGAAMDSGDEIDLNQDISGLSVQDLRLLRNSFYASEGYCFMKADLRGYFSANTDYYSDKMYSRWEADEMEGKPWPEIKLTAEQQAFVDRVKKLEDEKLKENFINREGHKVSNTDNIINQFQFKGLSKEFMSKLDKNGFVIVPNKGEQFFHVYEQNDYTQTPNFVTTDIYLQLFHMYFGYLLKSLEKEKFIPALRNMCKGFYDKADIAANNTNSEIQKETGEFVMTFFAIPYHILTGESLEIPEKYKEMYEDELEKIDDTGDEFSAFLDFNDAYFPYSLFKPRGHYTRDEEFKNYFKAMMWLQTAPFCRDREKQLQRAVLIAYFLNETPEMKTKYRSVLEPVTFLIGLPDNVSIMDLSEVLLSTKTDSIQHVFDKDRLSELSEIVLDIAEKKNFIRPKVEVSCRDKINFMPQRYLADNEILQEMVDNESVKTKRPFPKGLDIFTAFGSAQAEDVLLEVYKEEANWDQFLPKMNGLKDKFGSYTGWNKSVYNKWIESLLVMIKPDKTYPVFMQSQAWNRKNLNTALASWAELKHDAILYGEQPFAAECGGAMPPDPVTVGYVEPNVKFWKKAIELLDLTEKMMQENDLLTSDIKGNTRELKELTQFLLAVSEKELKGTKLSDQEYATIEIIGSSFENLTLGIVEPGKYLESWDDVKGPDRAVAVIADIYTNNNGENNPDKQGILHVATGNVNDIYVVVEIEGYLYLTKGATFSYYEFSQPPGTRRTDEEWQEMLEDGKVPAVPSWMDDIILPTKNPPVTDEKFFYDSGC